MTIPVKTMARIAGKMSFLVKAPTSRVITASATLQVLASAFLAMWLMGTLISSAADKPAGLDALRSYIAAENLYILCNPAVATPGLQLITTDDLKNFWRSDHYGELSKGVLSRPAFVIGAP